MAEVTIRCRKNGPLVIDGQVVIQDSNGKVVEADSGKMLIALCRCGHSERKPFCDGSHNRAGWSEEGAGKSG